MKLKVKLTTFSCSMIVGFMLAPCSEALAGRQSKIHRRAASSSFAKVPDVTLCELISSPSVYQNKIVRLQVTYVSGYHGAYFYDSACPEPAVSVWPDISCRSENDPKCREISEKLSRILDGKLRRHTRWLDERAKVILLGKLKRVYPRVKLRNGTVIIRIRPHPDYDFEVIKPLEACAVPDEKPWQ